MKGNNLQKIKDCFSGSCRYLAEHAFLIFLVLVFISLIFGGFLFYKYSFLIDKNEPKIDIAVVRLNEGLCQKVVAQWQDRQGRFDGASEKSYPDSFK